MSIKEGSKLNAIVPGNALKAIIPASFDDAVRMARLAVNAGFYKAPAKKKYGQQQTDEDEESSYKTAEAQATMAIMKGMEIGMPPLQALEVITIINGRSTVWGDGIPALLWSNGFEIDEKYENEDDPDKLTAVCTITRPGGKQITRKFGVPDALKAGLWDVRPKVTRKGKNGSEYTVENDSPWFKYGKRMLSMRARGWCARDGAPDVLRGLYMREEMEDMLRAENARDITPDRSPMIPTQEFLAPPPAPAEEEVREELTEEEFKQCLPHVPDDAEIEEFLSNLEVSLSACKATDEIDEVWGEHEDFVQGLPAQRREQAQDICTKHFERVRPQPKRNDKPKKQGAMPV